MGGVDKLLSEIGGTPVLAHTLKAFQNCGIISEIVVVTREDMLFQVRSICEKFSIDKTKAIIPGGATRLESVLNGVNAASRNIELIAIHDGARPCIENSIIESTVSAAAKHHAAAPGVKISSTVKKVKNSIIVETINRDELYEIQTPQVFTAEIIIGALTLAKKKSINVTDDCMAAEILGVPVHVTEGSHLNIKITTPEDIILAEAILRHGTS